MGILIPLGGFFMKVLFLDIDGVTVDANIQGYVRQIELFGDEPIKDFEYIKKCIKFMLDNAKNDGAKETDISFFERVYQYVSVNMFEMLKEYRDCFLEYDNLTSFEEKMKYMISYSSNPVLNLNNEEIPKYMKYIIDSLRYAKDLFENEYRRVESVGGSLKLPFETVNLDNDIISYDENEDPLKRATSALKRMEIYAINREKGRDDFLTACQMVGDSEIVDYNEIYSKKNLMPGVKEGLKYLISSGKVDMIVACSHFTGEREGVAKMRLFKEELPFVMLLDESLLKFHTEPAQMGKRRDRSSKNNRIDMLIKMIEWSFNTNPKFQQIADALSLNPTEIEAMLIDDSTQNLETLENKTPILFRKRKENETLDNEKYSRLENWSIESLDYTFENIQNNKNNSYVKKLI